MNVNSPLEFNYWTTTAMNIVTMQLAISIFRVLFIKILSYKNAKIVLIWNKIIKKYFLQEVFFKIRSMFL